MSGDDSHWQALVDRVNIGLPVIYPTSNLPALGCIPTSDALNELFKLKQRGHDMVVSLAVADLEQASEIVDVPKQARQLFEDFPPSSLTLILPALKTLDSRVGGDSIAIRIITTESSRKLLTEVGPLTATSANISGVNPLADCQEAAEALGIESNGFIPGTCSNEPPTTLIRCDDYATLTSGEQLQVLREGMISQKEVNSWSMKRI
ncbi:MAG: L-threonylcarbamoyladenylate synthase [Candidatus Poseidoniales archaeon]|nr:L-threonylcarbamoyladenylate synthase [Candidatus Poseidoniales archaeon]